MAILSRYQTVSILDFTGTKDDRGGSDTGAVRCAKLQSNHHHRQTNNQDFYRPDALSVTQQQCHCTEGKSTTIHGLAHPKLTWGLPILSLTTKGFRLSSGRVANPCQPSDISNQMTQHNNNNIIYLTFFNLLRPATATATATA